MFTLRTRLVAVALLAFFGAAGCGDDPGTSTPAGETSPQQSPGRQIEAAGQPSQPASSAPGAASSSPPRQEAKHAFPVRGNASYGRTHHDYPATDIIANCGLTAVSPVDGTVLEVTRVDTYNAKVNDGATRGGLSVSILGGDGARYYLSHFSAIDEGIEAGTPVTAGQPIAKIGRTGDASACHIHFGLSPACQQTGDWWTRRGVIWPWSYLDAWKAGKEKSPVAELDAWQKAHGCPAKATVDP